jgi:hypothetical protein
LVPAIEACLNCSTKCKNVHGIMHLCVAWTAARTGPQMEVQARQGGEVDVWADQVHKA